jgi:cephalosporin hydroxylase
MNIRTIIDVKISNLFQKFLTRGFNKVFYYRGKYYGETWNNTRWLGVPAKKYPMDLWVYQDIVYETQPDNIIETGTYKGGTSLFLANLCDLLKKGRVITIDLEECELDHPRIVKIIGDSTNQEVIESVSSWVEGGTAMVILDSNHRKSHVLKELELYSQFVSVGNYLIVEDTHLNGNPIRPDYGGGPMEAVNEFLEYNHNFVVDKSREKYFITSNPNGYLKRIK